MKSAPAETLTAADIRATLIALGLRESPTKLDGRWYAMGGQASIDDIEFVLRRYREVAKPNAFSFDGKLLTFGYAAEPPMEPAAITAAPARHCPSCSCVVMTP